MSFTPKPLPDKPDVQREFQRVSEAFRIVHQFDVLHVEPSKPRQGLLVFADGTDWDPGSGEGLYEYLSTGWSKL